MAVTENDLLDVNYWRELNPEFTITDTPFAEPMDEIVVDDALSGQIRHQMVHDGYFRLPTVFDDGEVSRLRELVLRLDANGVMPLFAAVYDEYWQMLYKLRSVMTPVLGEAYRLVPDFWVFFVDTNETSRGWGAHRDGKFFPESIRNDGTPTVLTAWIALTDADTTNSTMYALPRKDDVYFQEFLSNKFGHPPPPEELKNVVPMDKVRALPADAGSVLGWDLNLLHWGSPTSQWASGPRISIGVYYQGADATLPVSPYDSEGRKYVDCSDPEFSLSFEDRLVIVANNMAIYHKQMDQNQVQERHYNDVCRSFRDKHALRKCL